MFPGILYSRNENRIRSNNHPNILSQRFIDLYGNISRLHDCPMPINFTHSGIMRNVIINPAIHFSVSSRYCSVFLSSVHKDSSADICKVLSLQAYNPDKKIKLCVLSVISASVFPEMISIGFLNYFFLTIFLLTRYISR